MSTGFAIHITVAVIINITDIIGETTESARAFLRLKNVVIYNENNIDTIKTIAGRAGKVVTSIKQGISDITVTNKTGSNLLALTSDVVKIKLKIKLTATINEVASVCESSENSTGCGTVR